VAYCAFTQPATPSANTVVRVDTTVQVSSAVSPSCSFLLLSPADYQRLNTYTTSVIPTDDIDYSVCAAFWSFGLTTVVTLYLVSKYVGEIVGFIRTAIR
jgi:hypothetical protein